MIDLLLINPGCNKAQTAGELKNFLLPMPPIGIACIAAYVEIKGYNVACYDDFLNKSNDKKLIKRLNQLKPAVVGLPTFTSDLMYRVNSIVKIIRQYLPSSKVVFGNIHSNVFAEDILKNKNADFIVFNEGEETVCELIEHIRNNDQSYESVNGIGFIDKQNNYTKTRPRKNIKDLDTLPFPAWHLLPLRKYELFPFGKVKQPATLISGSRGCPYRCSFCSLIVHGSNRRVRSAKSIADEMFYFNSKYGIKQFGFVDPVFPINPKEGALFCKELIERKAKDKFVWITETRVDSLNREVIKLMGKAGCARIMFGVETPSQASINSLHKNFKASSVRNVISWCRDAGVESLGFFMLGLPDSTEKDLALTVKYALDSGLDYAKFSVFTPFPGTELYENLKNMGELDNNLTNQWERYTMYPTKSNPPIYLSKNISLGQLLYHHKQAHIKFYLRPKQIYLLLKYLTIKDYIRTLLYFIGNTFKNLKP